MFSSWRRRMKGRHHGSPVRLLAAAAALAASLAAPPAANAQTGPLEEGPMETDLCRWGLRRQRPRRRSRARRRCRSARSIRRRPAGRSRCMPGRHTYRRNAGPRGLGRQRLRVRYFNQPTPIEGNSRACTGGGGLTTSSATRGRGLRCSGSSIDAGSASVRARETGPRPPPRNRADRAARRHSSAPSSRLPRHARACGE